MVAYLGEIENWGTQDKIVKTSKNLKKTLIVPPKALCKGAILRCRNIKVACFSCLSSSKNPQSSTHKGDLAVAYYCGFCSFAA